MELAYYGSFWQRLRVCWYILWHGHPYPQPLEWYEPFCNLVFTNVGQYVERAVQKVEDDPQTRSMGDEAKRKEVYEWAHRYAREDHVQGAFQLWAINLMREFYVARKHGKI